MLRIMKCDKCGHYVSDEFLEMVKNKYGEYRVLCRDCFIDEQVVKFKGNSGREYHD